MRTCLLCREAVYLLSEIITVESGHASPVPGSKVEMQSHIAPVPLTALAAMAHEVWPAIESEYLAAMLEARYVGGPALERFEQQWAAYCGVTPAVGVANGTAALELALAGLGIGPGDEVIVPSNTFIATVAAVARAGATPRFADIGEETLLMTPQALAAAGTSRTRAAIIVHLYGQVP